MFSNGRRISCTEASEAMLDKHKERERKKRADYEMKRPGTHGEHE